MVSVRARVRPIRSPSVPLIRPVGKLWSVANWSNICHAPSAVAEASKWSGMRVVICTTSPMELPGKAAAKGPYSTSVRATASGAIRSQRGEALVLLLPIRAETSTPSS